MRLRLEYDDHNESFAQILPVVGTVARKLRSKGGSEWVLFQLDVPAMYDGVNYDYFLLRSRWRGIEIGGEKATSVFILLVADQHEIQDGFDVRSLSHVAWGMAEVI